MTTDPTLEDVARVAGVSRATASRAIRGAGRVSPQAREAVAAAVQSLRYVPNQAARSLVTRQSDTVALVVAEPDERIFTDPFFGSAIAGMVEALEPSNKQLVLAMRTRSGGDERLRRFLSRNHVDGVVVISHHADDHFTEVLHTHKVPAVFVGRPWRHAADVVYVDVDNYEGGRLAARHLIERGAARLATISGPNDMPAAQDRLAGWREGLRQAGLREVAAYEGDFTPASGARAARRMLAEHDDIDGVFVASDMMALAALREFAGRGIGVPDRLQLVGFDDSPAAAESRPGLTTLTNPARAMTATAARLLLELMAGEAVASPVVVQPHLIVRDSTRDVPD